MQILSADTAALPAENAFQRWRDTVQAAFGPLHVEKIPGASFHGSLRTRTRETFSFHTMEYRGMSLWRKPVDVAHLGGEYFTITLPTCGMLHVLQRGEEITLQTGGVYLFNHAVAYRTTPADRYSTTSIAIPAGELRRRIPSLDTFYDLSAACTNAVAGSLIASFARHLSQGVEAWTDHEFLQMMDQFLDSIGLFLTAPHRADHGNSSCTRIGHRQRATEYIRKHATDPELTPPRVALGCGVSLSYLHGVFRAADMSVEETIFDARLQVARRLLIDPRRARLPIGTLSYDAGFSDPAHFSRSFKRRFGVTPGELRRVALDAGT